MVVIAGKVEAARSKTSRAAPFGCSPELVVCLDCGTAEFVKPDAELRLLAKRGAAAAG
jgi:hypothetical protein